MRKNRWLIWILGPVLWMWMLSGCREQPEFCEKQNHTPQTELEEILESLSNSETPAESDFRKIEMRGIWVSYLDLSPLTTGKSEKMFSASAETLCKNAVESGCNALIVQVRPFCDSFYPSSYFPWSKWASGTAGKSLSYDPVRILREFAARASLDFHIWINPMRGYSEEQLAETSQQYPVGKWFRDKQKSDNHLLFQNGRFYLNPGSDEVRKLIADSAGEAVRQYQPEGVQIDDYFYPPDLSFEADQISYQQYLENGGTLSQGDWRRENIFQMGKEIAAAIRSEKEDAVFGVSPRADFHQNYEEVYFDTEKWMAEPKMLDYIAPQIYFGFQHGSAPFDTTAEKWDTLCTRYEIQFCPGLALYKAGQTDEYAGQGSEEWIVSRDILAKQVHFARELPSWGGFILFRYENLLNKSAADMLSALKSEITAPER